MLSARLYFAIPSVFQLRLIIDDIFKRYINGLLNSITS